MHRGCYAKVGIVFFCSNTRTLIHGYLLKLDPVLDSSIEDAAQQLLGALNRFVVALVRPQVGQSPQDSLNEKISPNRGELSSCRRQGFFLTRTD